MANRSSFGFDHDCMEMAQEIKKGLVNVKFTSYYKQNEAGVSAWEAKQDPIRYTINIA